MEKEGLKWDDLVQPLALFALNLGLQLVEGDPSPEEMEARRKAQEAEDKRAFAMADKYKEK